MISSLLLTGVLATYIGAETYSLGVERLIIKDARLPKDFHNLRVCYISDLHHGTFSSKKRLELMVKKINALKPDIILMGGDYLQTYKTKKVRQRRALKELAEILAQLKRPPLGMFSVSGNHDYVFGVDEVRAELMTAGVKTLDNQGVVLKRGKSEIYLAGVDDLWFGKPNLERALKGRKNADEFTMLLTHQPNFVDELVKSDGINFALAGHTHGAQCRFFGYMPFLPSKIARWDYTAGLIDTAATRMLVSPGIGTVAPYFRFFAAPKIHLLIFKSAPRLSI